MGASDIWDIHGQILRRASDLGIAIGELTTVERDELRDRIYARYTAGHKYDRAMWDTKYFAEHVSRQSDTSWRWCEDFVGNRLVLLFFNPSDDPSIFLVTGGHALVALLGEMFVLEYYLTDFSCDYLLCHNHHDFLIACGSARDWLANYAPETNVSA